jgi:hypothetical protein
MINLGHLCRQLATIAVFSIAAAAVAAPSETSVAPDRHAWLLLAEGAKPPSVRTVQLWRNNVVHPLTSQYLRPCDTLRLVDMSKVVLVQLADARVLVLSHTSPDLLIRVPCHQKPVLEGVAELLQSFMGSRSAFAARAAGMYSRTPPSVSGAPDVTLPLMDPQVLFLPPERSRFQVLWIGGVPPFAATLIDERTGQVVANSNGQRDRSASFVLPNERAGLRYRVVLRDERERGVVLKGIEIAQLGALPAMPKELNELSDAGMRAFLFAEYLASVDGGAWSLEAIQRMLELAPRSEAARAWLLTFGGAIP